MDCLPQIENSPIDAQWRSLPDGESLVEVDMNEAAEELSWDITHKYVMRVGLI